MSSTATGDAGADRHGIKFHPVIRMIAKVISILFHPLFIPVYVFLFFTLYAPSGTAIRSWDKTRLSLSVIAMYVIFPLATVLLCRALGFIESVMLRTQKDRIIPYVACGVYYFWMWYVLRNQPEFPLPLVMLAMGIFIASSLGLILNSFYKISMHTTAAGVMSTFVCLLGIIEDINMGFYISMALLATGMISTARMINSDHNPFEIYLGLLSGFAAQMIAYWVVM
jgi:hypothetical protein